ncbi:30S ribosome-binding factor RbfA [candidate division KSB1 bacterium]|nr:30S ribosome-binding factor RbfA [candidate division KSB1 bacterium]RQW11403.1 MAG: 30S ribosome-binding factor RbfA [candidate division KSB1 bacterium]
MHYKRSDRVAAFIRQEVGSMLVRQIKDPALALITVTKTRVTDDLRHAKIYYSVYGDEQKKDAAAKALERAKGFMRTELGHRLTLRFVPEITFVFDDTTEYADHIEHLLKKIKT